MNPITVNVSGTFSEKQRPNNGMERVGPYLNAHRLVRVPIVAYVEWHSHGETRTGEKMAVVIPALEPGITADGGPVPGLPVHDGYPADAAGQMMWLLDSIRRAGGKGAVADTLFSLPSDAIHGRDDDDDDRELEGQLPLVPDNGKCPCGLNPGFAAPEAHDNPACEDTIKRVGPDGPRVVPPPSGEELTAELDERRAATGPTRAEQETPVETPAKKDLRRRVTGSTEPADASSDDSPRVPAATFSSTDTP